MPFGGVRVRLPSSALFSARLNMKTIVKNFLEVFEERYASFALSVVTGRAIPDIRDGLKPVQRRIIFAMYSDLRLMPNGQTKKSASVIGNVLAKYHPHGDQSSYEALVRLAQPFSLLHPLVIGQGNFGSIDGDPPAAYRYTEVKLSELALELLKELNQNTVPFLPNFDGSSFEPEVLPARFPHLLVNGASGIAVGLSTAIPPHNLEEVCKACIELIKNPNASIKDILRILRGPDFPLECEIVAHREELLKIYSSGKGSIKLRALIEEVKLPRGKQGLIVKSVPYSVLKSAVLEKLLTLVEQKKASFIEDVRDESDKDIRIIVIIDSNVSLDKAKEFLLKHTPLEIDYPIQFTAIDVTPSDKYLPITFDIITYFKKFINFRKNTIKRKLEFEREKLLRQINLLEGIEIVLRKFDKFMQVIRKSRSRVECAQKLQDVFSISDKQAEFLVDLRIYQLSEASFKEFIMEKEKMEQESRQLKKILDSDQEINKVIIGELEEIITRYRTKRKCRIIEKVDTTKVQLEDIIGEEEWYIVVKKSGYIKRTRSVSEDTADENLICKKIKLNTVVTFFTNYGNLYALKAIDFPAITGNGVPLQNKLKMLDGERVIYAVTVDNVTQNETKIVLISRSGFGGIKVLPVLSVPRKKPKSLIKKDSDIFFAKCTPESGYLVLKTNLSRLAILNIKELPEIVGKKMKKLLKLLHQESLIDVLHIQSLNEDLASNLKLNSLEKFFCKVGGSPKSVK
ncbi:MAG: DNA topoisomerase [Deltaproteobacteria bacterium]|nr:DNA topoisomerase [Deltaproteobacteria bacterium]